MSCLIDLACEPIMAAAAPASGPATLSAAGTVSSGANAPGESWLPMRADPHHEVSSHGRVRRTGSAALLEQRPNNDGRMTVEVAAPAGARKRLTVANIVLDTFGQARANGAYTALCADGDERNLRVGNLSWVPSKRWKLESTRAELSAESRQRATEQRGVAEAPPAVLRAGPLVDLHPSLRNKCFDLFKEGMSITEVVDATGLPRVTVTQQHGAFNHEMYKAEELHATSKTSQIRDELRGAHDLDIYEVFGGKGFCTAAYRFHGAVTARVHDDGDCVDVTHAMLSSKRRYDAIDVDPWGFRHGGMLLNSGILSALRPERGWFFLSVPSKMHNRGNAYTREHNLAVYGSEYAEDGHVLAAVKRAAQVFRREASLLSSVKLMTDDGKRVTMTRYAFRVVAYDVRRR